MAEKKKQTYAQAIAELEEIVAKLQNNECEIHNIGNANSTVFAIIKYRKSKKRVNFVP